MTKNFNANHYITKYYIPLSLSLISLILVIFNLYKVETDNFELIKVGNNYEGCLGCHKNLSGFSDAHDPKAIGCASCHSGNPFSSDTTAAHKNLILIPGNIRTAKQTCGQLECHPLLTENIQTSLMTTGRGMVTVNRYVFGESSSPDGQGNISEIGFTASDIHLRNLCASCHLALQKTIPDTIHQLSRGGGCLACHLQYSHEAKEQMLQYKTNKALPTSHPSLSIQITNQNCFGCHSRSGRISTNYEGWHETLLDSVPVANPHNYRELDDGRIFVKQTTDVHHQKGLDCIDCHTWRETMGDGNSYNHQEQQVEISCQDCHRTSIPKYIKYKQLNDIEKKIIKIRNYKTNKRYIKSEKTGNAILNITQEKDNKFYLIKKNTNRLHQMNSPLSICTFEIKGHHRLTCKSCHSRWAPHCLGCHTQYIPSANAFDHLKQKDINGGWIEFSSDFFADLPTLGIRKIKNQEVIDTFIPGMILTIIHEDGTELFRRLYAPTAPHTTVKKARDCKSCHNNPLAIGFGRGKLFLENEQWQFIPLYTINPVDQLPEDAWTGFLQTRTEYVSTRSNTRPFNRIEQQKILQVGSCLTCHKPDNKNLEMIYFDYEAALELVTKSCVKIDWN